MQQFPPRLENVNPAIATICCVPNICHVVEPIMLDNLSETVKVICNNESCTEGEYMHKICFEQWEYTVLTYLRSTGRARSWSEKQRLQNLWTKKGYDLAYKACSCKCGKGHLRKDLDWIPPAAPVEDQAKKKKHRKKKNDKPTLSITGNAIIPRSNASMMQQVPPNRIRSSSMSSMSSASGSPPNFTAMEANRMSPPPPGYKISYSCFSRVLYRDSDVTVMEETHRPSYVRDRPLTVNYNLFSRRQDFSSFNTLHPTKINSYHIRIDNESSADACWDERAIVFRALSARKLSRVSCIFCSNHMIVFDRYPLIDGTFFISPQKYSESSIILPTEKCSPNEVCREYFLNAICMSCLEGWNTVLTCNFCKHRWDGSDLILGTMYSYDVIVARPCCEMRFTCKFCGMKLPRRRVEFFSDYSRLIACPNCSACDYHFLKSLNSYTKEHNTNLLVPKNLVSLSGFIGEE